MNLDLNSKKNLVDKYLKKNKMNPLLDILINNVDKTDMNIILTYQEKANTYRVNWIDLSAMENNNISVWMNSNLMFPDKVERIKQIIALNGISEDYIDTDDIQSNIKISSFMNNYECNKRVFEFRRYLPSSWKFLSEVLVLIFSNMPKFCFSFYQIMMEKLVKPEINYIFSFDMNKTDLGDLFDKNTKMQGTEYFNDNKVIKLEKINNTTYGIVRGTKEYLTSIIYNDDDKEIEMACTCSDNKFCKHLYASYLAMKEKKYLKYYKITYKNDKKTLLERMKNFEYFLCLGISDNFFIVIQNNQLIALPIINKEKKFNWEIIEDDDEKSLTKAVSKYLKDNNFENDND